MRLPSDIADSPVAQPPGRWGRTVLRMLTLSSGTAALAAAEEFPQGGHGFSLHSAALARELGGSLTVHSEGPGCGAMCA